MAKEKRIQVGMLIGILLVLSAIIINAANTSISPDLIHFINGMGYGLILPTSISLFRMKRKTLAK